MVWELNLIEMDASLRRYKLYIVVKCDYVCLITCQRCCIDCVTIAIAYWGVGVVGGGWWCLCVSIHSGHTEQKTERSCP